MPPLPETGESEYDRFKRFAKAILAVPKSQIETPEQILLRLKAERRGSKARLQRSGRRSWNGKRDVETVCCGKYINTEKVNLPKVRVKTGQ